MKSDLGSINQLQIYIAPYVVSESGLQCNAIACSKHFNLFVPCITHCGHRAMAVMVWQLWKYSCLHVLQA